MVLVKIFLDLGMPPLSLGFSDSYSAEHILELGYHLGRHYRTNTVIRIYDFFSI